MLGIFRRKPLGPIDIRKLIPNLKLRSILCLKRVHAEREGREARSWKDSTSKDS